MFRINLIIGICLIAIGLSAQVAAPKSVAVNRAVAATTESAAHITDPINENGEPIIDDQDHEIIVVIELELDQELKQVEVQIIDDQNNQSVLSQGFDLIIAEETSSSYRLQRNGKVIQLNLGVRQLPIRYRCEVKLEDINGEWSPAKVYYGLP
ncbi:MAG: hypothetical protein AAFP19_08550 [Bacteroidota bacterium]